MCQSWRKWAGLLALWQSWKLSLADKIEELAIVRDGSILYTVIPGTNDARFEYVDEAFGGNSYYYVRVIQADKDEQKKGSEHG